MSGCAASLSLRWVLLRLVSRAVAVALLLFLLLGPLTSNAETLSADEYTHLLARVEELLAPVAEAGQESHGVAAEAAALLRTADQVSQAGSALRPVNEHILAALEDHPPRLESALSSVRAVRAAVERAPGTPWDETAVDQLAAILALPEFQSSLGFGALDPLIGPVLLQLRRALLEALVTVGELLLGQGEFGIYVAGVLALAVVVAAAVFVWRSLGGSVVADLREGAPRGGRESANSLILWQEGETLTARGEFRPAIHAFFLSAAVHLDELELLRFDPSLTNRELLGRLRDAGVRSALAELVSSYDRVWYGPGPFGAREAERVQRLAAQVRSLSL